MRTILASRTVDYPEDVTVTVEGRKVVVKGPRGELSQDFNHIDVSIAHSAETVRTGAPSEM